jgi:RNA polymerase sigma-70 factor (ECF subfamily)
MPTPGRATASPWTSASAPALTTEQVFEEHATFAWRVLCRLGVSDDDVDDVFQEVFVVVHRKLRDFAGRSSVRTWLYGICVRVAADHRRRRRVRREVAAAPLHDPAVAATQEDAAALRQACATLDRILDTLDDARRAVFVLYEIEELPMSEVAAAVGCPLQTAYSRLHAARREVESAIGLLRTGEAGR